MAQATQLEQLHTHCRQNGQHVALHAEKMRLSRLVIEEAGKEVRGVSMLPPRCLTVDQAARELLP